MSRNAAARRSGRLLIALSVPRTLSELTVLLGKSWQAVWM
jgi:hypothetical protein